MDLFAQFINVALLALLPCPEGQLLVGLAVCNLVSFSLKYLQEKGYV